METLKLAYVGGLGLMASPAATHLSPISVAKVLGVHDRGTQSDRHNHARKLWQEHGAELCSTIASTLKFEDLDGVVICCGKNGDDAPLVGEVCKILAAKQKSNLFILHLSTVSTEFVKVADQLCSKAAIQYLNYPLTGGPLGAEAGGKSDKGMLILASGNSVSYKRLEAFLKLIGKPRYLGENATQGAETKLIGHHLVFNGLIGAISAVALHAEGFTGTIGGTVQTEYFDFLNQGAGGTRQWEIAVKKGVADNSWDQGFLIPHALIDAIYAAQLAIDRKLARISVQPMLEVALAFSYLVNKYPEQIFATHAIVKEILGDTAVQLDQYMNEHGRLETCINSALKKCIASLPNNLKKSLKLDIALEDFIY